MNNYGTRAAAAAVALALLALLVPLARAADIPDTPAPAAAAVGEKSIYVAGNLQFYGSASYYITPSAGTVYASFDKLENVSATNTSGPIEVRLIVTTQRVSAGATSYWTLGRAPANPLPPYYYYGSVSGTVAYTPPPDGIYYVTLGAFEQEPGCNGTGGWCLDGYIEFPNPKLFVNGGVYDPIATAVEYYYPPWNQYFITGFQAEIDALDGGRFPGWVRTGYATKVWAAPVAGTSGLCRFFSTTFAPKSSHFYTPIASECAAVKQNPSWQFEDVTGYVVLPTSAGTCTTGIPLYRLYNNGQGGAPNHRYTISTSVRASMIGQGWIPEGYGPLGVIACVPA